MKVFKSIVKVVLALVLVLLVLLVLVYVKRDAILDAASGQIKASLSVSAQTQIDFQHPRLEFFPLPYLALENITLSGGQGETTFKVSAAKGSLSLKLWEAIFGTVRLESLRIDSFIVEILQSDTKFAVEKTEARAGKANELSHDNRNDDRQFGAESDSELVVKLLELHNGKLVYRKNGELIFTISNLNAATRLSAKGADLVLADFSGNFIAPEKEPISIYISELDIRQRGTLIEVNAGRINHRSSSLPFSFSYRMTSGSWSFATQQALLSMDSMSLMPKGYQNIALIKDSVGQLSPEFRCEGTAGIYTCSGKALLEKGSFRFRDLLVEDLSSKLQFTLGADKQVITVQEATAAVMPGVGKVSISGELRGPAFEGDLQVRADRVDVRKLSEVEALHVVIPQKLSGTGFIAVDTRVTFGATHRTRVAGTVSLISNSLQYGDMRTSSIEGKLQLNGFLENLELSTTAIAARLEPHGTPLQLSGQLKVGGPGKLRLTIEALAVTQLDQILRATSTANLSLVKQGVLTGSIELGLESKAAPQLLRANADLVNIVFDTPNIPIRLEKAVIDVHPQSLLTRINLKSLTGTIRNEAISMRGTAHMKGSVLELENINGEGFGGTFKTSGSYELNSHVIRGRGELLNLDAAKLMQMAPETTREKLSGLIEKATFRIDNARTEDIGNSIRGEAAFLMRDGIIRGVNLGRLVVDGVGRIPLIGRDLLNDIPPEFDPYLKKEDTEIKELYSRLEFRDGKVYSPQIELLSDFYQVQGKGYLGLNQALSLDTAIVFNREFSTELTRKVRELDRIRNRDGTLTIPLQLKGRLPAVSVHLDTKNLVQSGAQRLLEEQLERGLEGLLKRSNK